MQEIILSRAEFLVLLDALDVGAVVGFDAATLFPEAPHEQRRLVEQGQESLATRGLLRVTSDGVHVIDSLLMLVAAVVARPDIASITVRDIPRIGQQLFLHYQSGAYLVEQTLPAEGTHRLATLPDQEALLDRLLAIFPPPTQSVPDIRGVVSQEIFLAAKARAEEGDIIGAAALLEGALTPQGAADLCAAIASPVVSGTIALLRCADEEIVDARNPALLIDEQSAWTIAQSIPGEPVFTITRVDPPLLRIQLMGWWQELTPIPSR